MSNVIQLPTKRPDLQELVSAIKETVYRNKGLTVTEAIGALEIAKLEIWMEQERAQP